MPDEFNPSQPIYFQLVQRICRQVVRGHLTAGEKLPSVRDMALESGVNPNTIQRVYAELERMGVIEAKRGQGSFVTEDTNRLNALRDELMVEHITAFLGDMSEMGFTPQEIIAGLQEHLKKNTSDEA